MTGAGPGLEKLKMPGPGQSRDRNFFSVAGPGFKFFLLLGPGFFYCRGRGRAGIRIFLIVGAGPGFKFFIAGSGAGPESKILKGPGPGRTWKN